MIHVEGIMNKGKFNVSCTIFESEVDDFWQLFRVIDATYDSKRGVYSVIAESKLFEAYEEGEVPEYEILVYRDIVDNNEIYSYIAERINE